MLTTAEHSARAAEATACEACPAVLARRAFLRDMAVAAAAAVGAVSLLTPATAFAEAVSEIAPTGAGRLERTYAIPAMDGVFIDLDSSVLLARWQNTLYAFSLKCPHKGARLEWRPGEQRVFCPKHNARFLGDGSHVSGRGDRDLDRYAVRRGASGVIVDVTRVLRQDVDAEAWQRAAIAL